MPLEKLKQYAKGLSLYKPDLAVHLDIVKDEIKRKTDGQPFGSFNEGKG